MKSSSWLLGAGTGFGVGFAVAATMTFLDWRLNPGGIFHDEMGTHWKVVWDTAISWFLPVAAIATVTVWVVLWALTFRK